LNSTAEAKALGRSHHVETKLSDPTEIARGPNAT
jgi:hypothetical protein